MNLEELVKRYGEKKAAKTVFKYWKAGKTLEEVAVMFETDKDTVRELLTKWYPFLRNYSPI